MFKTHILAGFALSAAALLQAPLAQAIEPGQPAPAIDIAGPKQFHLEKLRGKVVYLDFWASWCGPCRQSFPWMNEMQAKYGTKGLQVVGVNLDSKSADADKFLAEVPATFLVAFDSQGASAKRYQIKGMPSSVLIDAEGKVIQLHSGFRADERKTLEDAIVAALANVKPPAP